jgi:hypothetical protein
VEGNEKPLSRPHRLPEAIRDCQINLGMAENAVNDLFQFGGV